MEELKYPDWVKYKATYLDGSIFGFEKKLYLNSNGSWVSTGREVCIGDCGCMDYNYKESLTTWNTRVEVKAND